MRLLPILAVLGLLALVAVYGKDCEQKNLCSCQYDDGSVVDITSLGNTDNTPRFKDIKAESEGNYYSFNPCTGFSEDECSDASVCILNPDKTESVQIGDSSKAGYKYDEESQELVVAYTSGTLSNLKLSEIILICDPNACEPSIVANGQQDGGNFQMTLTTVCACPNGCSSSGPTNCSSSAGGLSFGSILCIALFVLLAIYIAVGITINAVKYKARGSDVMPQKTFWAAVPGLVVTGFKFTFSKLTRRPVTYDAI